MTILSILHHVPEGLLEARSRDLHRLLAGPTLLELPGEAGAPLFVSGLMHGNEDSGLGAIQSLLRRYHDRTPTRPLMLLIGNVAAAAQGKRRLDGQPDYNRVWPGGTENQNTEEARIMADVHARVVKRRAFAAIDIHNNTGRNPHYGVVCAREPEVMSLAAMFAPRAVLFRGLPGTQTASFSGHVPALTLECGQPGSAANAASAGEFIEDVLRLKTLPSAEAKTDKLALFHTLAQVKVKPEIRLKREDGADWLVLEDGLDLVNFQSVRPGLVIGHTNHPMPLEAIDESGRDSARVFFENRDGMLRFRQALTPAMLTQDEHIIRQDCLCYLMEELD